ncbi:MAG: flagellar biosynthetic protein FliQ [Planctomycetes bacterium]|nr:flagellar biosynthetic protein FliQ [Planctomycetota bacterium]
MTLDDTALDLVRNALIVALKISMPVLLAGIVVGLVISVVQSVTSIQDQTLSSVPKIVVMIVAAAVLLPWVVQRLIEYSTELFRLT